MPRASAISWDYPFDKKPIYKKSESSDTWAVKRNYLQKRRQCTDRVMQVFKNQKNIFLLSRWTLFALEVLFNIELLTSIGYSVGGGGGDFKIPHFLKQTQTGVEVHRTIVILLLPTMIF